jgi:hypothetical protein
MDEYEEWMPCDNCFFNRPMKAWGETFQACYHGLETGKEIFRTVQTPCSGYEQKEKQLELNI